MLVVTMVVFALTRTTCVVLQVDLRERETAAAVEDLEVRQMELEAQRRRLEQVITTFHSAFSVLCKLAQLCLF